MGSGHFNSEVWANYKADVKTRSVSEVYKNNNLEYANFGKREALDNDDHPNSIPIILGLDVTGSMGTVLKAVASSIGDLMSMLIKDDKIKHPQIASMAIGDVFSDSYPIQFTQFESDNRCVDQLTNLYFEQGGGANNNESYLLAWLVAAYMTRIDSFDKRNKKGYLFTFGDENPTEPIPKIKFPLTMASIIDQVFVQTTQVTSEMALMAASEKWNCYHLIIEKGSYCSSHRETVMSNWNKLMSQNAIPVSDISKIPEIIMSIIRRTEGESLNDIVKSWDSKTSEIVLYSLKDLQTVSSSSNAPVVL